MTRRQEDQINNVAILRLEQLYPFPIELLKTEIAKYKNAKELIWCQEEPINQGAWYTSRHNFMNCTNKKQTLHVVSRDLYSAPAEGSLGLHNLNQNYVIEQALGIQPINPR